MRVAPPGDRGPRTERAGIHSELRHDLLWALAAMALAFGLAAWVLRLWRANLDVPFLYISDGNLNQALIQGVLEEGWFYENSRLGAPFGLELYDFPVLSGDALNVVLIKLIGLFSSDSAVVLNTFFLLTFPLAALTAYLALRLLRISMPVAVVFAALYALAPYHFGRGINHVLLSAYYAVPLGVYLALAVLAGHSLVERSGTRRGRLTRFASGRTLLTLGLCAVVALASGSFYYAWFTVLLVVAAALLRFAAMRRARDLVAPAVIVTAIGALAIVQLAPTIVYQLRHGENPQVAERHSSESEAYSLRPAQLVLPLESHRLEVLANRRRAYEAWDTSPDSEALLSTLGTVAALGFVGSLLVLLVSAVPRARRRASSTYRRAGLLALVCLLVATHGGLSSLMGSIYPQFRAWNRLSIFIAFLGVLTVGLFVDRLLRRRLPARPWARTAAGSALVAVLVLGTLDQTSDAFIPPYDALETEYRHDAAFVEEIERRLPKGAMVFELPHYTFPEPLPTGTAAHEYDLIRPYLHSSDLRWSYGAMRGRLPADWAARFAGRPLSELVPGIAAAGFDGVYLARQGYVDVTPIEGELGSLLGQPVLRSPNGQLAFYDLHPYREQLQRRLSPRELRLLRATTLGRGG